MGIEERLNRLEAENETLKEKVERLEHHYGGEFVSPERLAQIMDCNVQSIYRKIRSGKILADKKVSGYRIPMNQFYPSEPDNVTTKRRRSADLQKKTTIQEMVFGEG